MYDPRAILVEVASYAEPLKNRVGFTCKGDRRLPVKTNFQNAGQAA